MKLVSFASFKGGCGKSTSIMAIASMLCAKGKHIAIFDSDMQQQQHSWRNKARSANTWDEACQVYRTDDLPSFEQAYEKATDDGVEIALIDTHGGASELNQAAIINSQLVVVPSGLTDLDITSTLDTMRYIAKLQKQEKIGIVFALLWQRFPTTKLTSAEEKYYKALDRLDQFENKLFKRDALTSIGSSGMMHLYHRKISEDKKLRLKAGTFGVAVNEADNVTKDLLEILEAETQPTLAGVAG